MNLHTKIPRGPLWVLAGFGALTVALVGVLYGQFDYSELCTVCGRARDGVAWQVPLTQFTYYRLQEERATSLSTMLGEHALVADHIHDWQFVRGQGNGRTVVLGTGHPISWSLQSPHMGAFMETMLRWTDRDTTLRWLGQLRDPQYARLCQFMASDARDRSFSSRDQWEDWLHHFELEHAQMIVRPDEFR